MGLIAWSALGRGVLSGKYRSGIPADSRAGNPVFASFVQPYLTEGARRIADATATAAEGLGVSPTEVALAWVRDQPGVTAALVGTRTAAQLRTALASEELHIPRRSHRHSVRSRHQRCPTRSSGGTSGPDGPFTLNRRVTPESAGQLPQSCQRDLQPVGTVAVLNTAS